ncbi:MAG TPA: hypothetical protein PKY78_07330 [Candidatus Omnitrophota bacterium]|nr:hypothetical protein [Candidatus Omnitrophota bacterium]
MKKVLMTLMFLAVCGSFAYAQEAVQTEAPAATAGEYTTEAAPAAEAPVAEAPVAEAPAEE